MTLTLEDIGRLAGVSRSTVSRVINSQESVSSDVRDRVMEVIDRTGYVPNAAARSLVSGKSGVIGLVIPSRVHSLFEDPYFSRLIQGISSATNRAGITLSLFLFQTDDEDASLYPRVVTSGFLDGLIITATRTEDPLLQRLVGSPLPIVMIGRPDVGGISYVDVDNQRGGLEAARHLTSLGHRRIGVISAPDTTTAGVDRLAGFVDGLAESGVALPPELREHGDFTEESGFMAMNKLVEQKPEAVFVASDTMASGALRALQELRIRVPDDISVIGFDGLPHSESSIPKLTTIRQPVRRTAAAAVDLLNRLIDGDASVPTSEIMPIELIIRESTAAPTVSRTTS